MPRRKLKASLTAQVFCLTALILLSASAVTYGLISLTAPLSYTAAASELLRRQAETLCGAIQNAAPEEYSALLAQFIQDTGASAVLAGSDGTFQESAITVYNGEDGTQEIFISQSEAAFTMDTSVSEEDTMGGLPGIQTAGADQLVYHIPLSDGQDSLALMVFPPAQEENLPLQALGRVAPWLLAAMLLFSALCALLYSRFITRPIVRISAISQKMAELDFSRKCGGNREDEIGVLAESLDMLSSRLSQALDSLREANAALRADIDRERELDRERLAFFSAASHELKTPVTILKGQLSGMLEGVDVYQDRDKYLARALQVTGRMEGLVQELLDVSRMESGGSSLNCQKVDLNRLVREQAALLEDLAEQKHIQLSLSLPGEAVISAEPALLRKVLDNLLANALFFSPEGAGVSVSVGEVPEGVWLRVDNSGSRIPEEALPQVFEAFYRADTSRNRRTGGSGLGLYIVQMILDRHGAEYKIENTEDGVRFTALFRQTGGLLE